MLRYVLPMPKFNAVPNNSLLPTHTAADPSDEQQIHQDVKESVAQGDCQWLV